ncbi:uncharacterized protein LOC144086826 [Stigmatopora argus]
MAPFKCKWQPSQTSLEPFRRASAVMHAESAVSSADSARRRGKTPDRAFHHCYGSPRSLSGQMEELPVLAGLLVCFEAPHRSLREGRNEFVFSSFLWEPFIGVTRKSTYELSPGMHQARISRLRDWCN